MTAREASALDGVLVVDKPCGPTSHDVVALARRALGTRSVGHAGTLDPMATGVLVVAVGEATKLVRWLTADAKAYRATVVLGTETDTLDAEGRVTERAPIPAVLTLEYARAVAARFVGTMTQRPPAFSAIKVAGRALHERARRGEAVEAPERIVTVHRLEILAIEGERLELAVEASKGFYVRSLARDLALALGTRGHLGALRRTQSGPFTLEGALDEAVLRRAAAGDRDAREVVRAKLLPLAAACAGMPTLVLEGEALVHARHGRPISTTRVAGALTLPRRIEPVALVDPSGALVAVGAREGDRIRIVRGMRS